MEIFSESRLLKVVYCRKLLCFVIKISESAILLSPPINFLKKNLCKNFSQSITKRTFFVLLIEVFTGQYGHLKVIVPFFDNLSSAFLEMM